MSTFGSSPLQRVFVMPQTALRTLPNATGTPTLTTAKLIPHRKVTLTPFNELITADYKTGTGSMLAGQLGRKGPATWSLDAPFRPSGTAGTAPDLDGLLSGAFGATATLVAATSATYNFTDTHVPFSVMVFDRSVSTATQMWALGCIPTDITLNIGGGGYFAIQANGKCVYVMTNDNFANEDVIPKAGWTTAPTEPTAPTIAGNNILPFSGTLTIGGTSTAEFRSASLSIATGKDLRADGYLDPYPDAIVQGRRMISLKSLKCANSDSAALIALKNAAFNKTALDVVIALTGSGAGYTVTTTLKQVQFGNAVINENGAAFDVDFGDSPAHASAVGVTNDLIIALT